MIGAVVNVFLNFILIPKIGITGAALSTLASTWVIAYVTWQKMKEINDFKIWPSIQIILPETMIMLVATFFLKYLGFGVFQNIIISSIIYFMFLFLIKKKTLTELKDIVGIHSIDK
jgi:O-antigen/teichoic acid export membrane protein